MAQKQFGTAGRFGILKQTAFETPQTNDSLFHYLPFTNEDMGPTQQQGQLPSEAGGITKSLPRGVFKTGAHAEGGVDIIPRLDEHLMYWLECLTGAISSYPDQNIAQVIAGSGTTTDVNTHLFAFVDGDDFDIPYFTAHRLLPHTTSTSEVGETFEDCRMVSWMLNAPAANLVTSRFDMVGRLTNNPWKVNPAWPEPVYDLDTSFMVTACSGQVKMSVTDGTPGTTTEFDVLAARLTWTNIIIPPNRMRKIGSAHPVDFPMTGRAIGIDVTVYVDSYQHYLQTFVGPQTVFDEHGWSCSPLYGDVDVILQSPALIGSTAEYYKMRFLTNQGNVGWTARPIVLQPNQPVILALRGTITEAAAGRDCFLYIQNEATYA